MSSDPSPSLFVRDLCFIDVETTGSVFGYHEVIEVGAVRVFSDASVVKAEMSFKLRPHHPNRLTDVARAINGYSENGWQHAEDGPSAKWKEFSAFAIGCVPVCHNPSFDRAFIELSAQENGVTNLGMDYHWIGTETLAWPLFRSGRLQQLTLKTLCEFFGIPHEPIPHRALAGAMTCLAVYRALMNSPK